MYSPFDKTVASATNPLFREWLELLTSKGIRKQGLFLISGEKAIAETLTRFPGLARSLFVCSERHATHPLIAKTKAMPQIPNAERFTVIALAKQLFDALDVAGTHQPILLTRTPEVKEADLSQEPQGLEILCALGDPSNVGALLRSVAAFGAAKVILLRECASPFHPKAVRAASASTLLTKLERGPSIKDLPAVVQAHALKTPTLALDMFGKTLAEFKWPKNARLLIGEEGQGVPNSKAFELLSIPMEREVESLNATVAASIALYSYKAASQKV